MNYCIFQLIKDANVKLKKSSYKPEEMVEIYEHIANLERIARTEGILEMEAYAMEIAEVDQYQKYQDFCLEDVLYGVNSGGTLTGAKLLLVQLTLLFVNGNGDKLEDIGIYKYLSEDYQGAEALKACMVIEGMKSVFNGEYSSTLKRLEAMVPHDVAILIQERKKAERIK